jgi:hypothetical protein
MSDSNEDDGYQEYIGRMMAVGRSKALERRMDAALDSGDSDDDSDVIIAQGKRFATPKVLHVDDDGFCLPASMVPGAIPVTVH